MEGTRFYYADAAVQRYLMNTASSEGEGSFEERKAAFSDLQDESFRLIGIINMVLGRLLKQFIALKHNERSR